MNYQDRRRFYWLPNILKVRWGSGQKEGCDWLFAFHSINVKKNQGRFTPTTFHFDLLLNPSDN